MSKRDTTNDRTFTLSDEALKKLKIVPRMERSKFVDKAIIAYPLEGIDNTLSRIEALEKRMKELEDRLEGIDNGKRKL